MPSKKLPLNMSASVVCGKTKSDTAAARRDALQMIIVVNRVVATEKGRCHCEKNKDDRAVVLML